MKSAQVGTAASSTRFEQFLPVDSQSSPPAPEHREDAGESKPTTPMTWMQRLRRVFEIDLRYCPRCGGPVRVIAAVIEPALITRILQHLDVRRQRQRYVCTRTRAHLQPRHLRFSSCRGFRSRPDRTGTNSAACGVRPEHVCTPAWHDVPAQGSSVSIASSESIAPGCAGAAKHRDVRERPSLEPQISNSPIPRQLIHLRL